MYRLIKIGMSFRVVRPLQHEPGNVTTAQKSSQMSTSVIRTLLPHAGAGGKMCRIRKSRGKRVLIRSTTAAAFKWVQSAVEFAGGT